MTGLVIFFLCFAIGAAIGAVYATVRTHLLEKRDEETSALLDAAKPNPNADNHESFPDDSKIKVEYDQCKYASGQYYYTYSMKFPDGDIYVGKGYAYDNVEQALKAAKDLVREEIGARKKAAEQHALAKKMEKVTEEL